MRGLYTLIRKSAAATDFEMTFIYRERAMPRTMGAACAASESTAPTRMRVPRRNRTNFVIPTKVSPAKAAGKPA
jgi:hypothetical protein